MNYVRLACRDLLRNPLRLTLTILAGAVGVTAFIFLRTVIDIFYFGAEAAQVDRLIVRNKVAITQPLPLSYYARIAALPGVTAVTHQEWFGGTLGETQKDFFANFAVDPGTFLGVFPEFVTTPAELSAFRSDPCGALIGEKLARRFGWKTGDRVTLKGQIYPGDWTFNVRGIYTGARPSTDTTALMFGYRCLNESTRLPKAMKDQVGIYAVRVDDPARSTQVAAAIDAMFDNSPYPTKTESEKAFQLGFVAMSSAILTAVKVVSTVILLIILLVIGNTLAMGVRERTRDIATLRAMGFRPRTVVMLVLAESSVIGFAAAALGVLAAPSLVNGFARLIASQFGQLPDNVMRGRTLVVSALAAVVVSLLAGVGPALRAVRLPVAEGLRKVA
ncbi:ABC transporter permease [Pyxidicoccus sp. MSG2]|uniref:ABC transporter permease n=1 Tax=Pyxidicoccus sp. MSG2 TaxID=2996790 RepID=UPI00226F35B5|nr:FtsX-like permease family protein [Pyxidicoccus sp. MSG2]MCY1019215.1 ABC transporter permease [Pyxidicoccus sp. MSG2]